MLTGGRMEMGTQDEKVCSCGHPESRHDRFGCHYPGCDCRAFELLRKCPHAEAMGGGEDR